jgi:ParB-like chromosome segregation protein Spo0J
MGNVGLMAYPIIEQARVMVAQLATLPDMEMVETINEIKLLMHDISPMRGEPVDCVLWVPAADVVANDYNPNKVAPPEMKLLEHSIKEDGFTQPIVTWLDDETGREVIDGFHRKRVGTECTAVRKRTMGLLPVTTINENREGRSDRISATIRHNRARGKHQVQAMSEIVVELSRRNHSDAWIGRELGMEPDEVLRLKQISGLAEMFADRAFSEAWEIDG